MMIFVLNNAVVTSNPSTKLLLSKLLADRDELSTEPVVRTSDTVYAKIGLTLQKVIDMVRLICLLFADLFCTCVE